MFLFQILPSDSHSLSLFLYLKVINIDCKENPTEELLSIWMCGKGSKTVSELIKLLEKIERYDAIRSLQQHEYTVCTNGN